MRLKFYLFMFCLAAVLNPGSASAVPLFPDWVDPGGYDAVEDTLAFTPDGAVRGAFYDNTATGSVSDGDSATLFYDAGSIGGVNVGFIVSLDIGALSAGVNSLAAATGGLDGGDAGAIGLLLPTRIAAAGLSTTASSTGVLVTSDSIDFSSISGLSSDTGFKTAFDVAGVNVEAIIDISAGFATGSSLAGTILLGGGYSVASDVYPPPATSYLPVADPSGLGLFDLYLGSAAPYGGTSLTFSATPSGQGEGGINPVPEPGSALAVLGCVATGGWVQRRRKRRR